MECRWRRVCVKACEKVAFDNSADRPSRLIVNVLVPSRKRNIKIVSALDSQLIQIFGNGCISCDKTICVRRGI